MRWLVVVAVGCGGAAPSAQLANATHAGRPPATLEDTWPTLASGDIVARTPAGPFADLAAVCAAIHHDPSDGMRDGCATEAYDELRGPIVRFGVVRAWERAARFEHVALQTRAGWYVLPRIADTGPRDAMLSLHAESAAGGLVIRYNLGASGIHNGAIACAVVDGAPACTPRIPTLELVPGADGLHLELDCELRFAGGRITVSPTPDWGPDDDSGWTPEAAAACRDLPYAGSHAVTF